MLGDVNIMCSEMLCPLDFELAARRENQHYALNAKTKSQHFVFAALIVQFLYFLNPKYSASSHIMCLYSSVCVGPVRIFHAAQIYIIALPASV